MIELLGLVGMLILAGAGIPQVIKTLKDGHADGLSDGMVYCWLLGCSLLLIYTLVGHPNDWILIANYGLSLIATLIIIAYKFRSKK